MIPLVICAGPGAIRTAALASHYYGGHDIEALVIRPAKCTSLDSLFSCSTHFIDDESICGFDEVARYCRSRQGQFEDFNRSGGWFVQQYIKLAYRKSVGDDVIFIGDGDTIFSHELLDSILAAPNILTTNERHAPYDRLLEELRLVVPPKSCVANGNFFIRSPVFDNYGSPEGFIDLMESKILPSSGSVDLSEYQIAGSLLQGSLPSRQIRMFRRFDLLASDPEGVSGRTIENALHRYDAIAFEFNHRNNFVRRSLARLRFAVGSSW